MNNILAVSKYLTRQKEYRDFTIRHFRHRSQHGPHLRYQGCHHHRHRNLRHRVGHHCRHRCHLNRKHELISGYDFNWCRFLSFESKLLGLLSFKGLVRLALEPYSGFSQITFLSKRMSHFDWMSFKILFIIFYKQTNRLK